MENPERATFYFYEGPERVPYRTDGFANVEVCQEQKDESFDINVGDRVKIYVKPYNLIANYTAIVKEIMSNIAIIEITTIRKREVIKISLKDHLIKKI